MKQFIQIGKNIYYIFTMSKRTKGQRVPTSNYLVLKKKIAHPKSFVCQKMASLSKRNYDTPQTEKKKKHTSISLFASTQHQAWNRAVYTFNVENLI